MAAGQDDQLLGLVRLVVGGDGQLGRNQVVTYRHQQQERRRADVGQVGDGLVLGEHLDAAQGDLVAPGRGTGLAGFGEPLPGVRGRQRRRGERILVNHRDHDRLLALEAGQPVGLEHLAEPGNEVGPDQRAEVVVAADQRDLADHGLDPAVDRRDHQDVAARVAAPPDPDPGGVHLGQGGGVGNGVPVVADLRPRVDLLPGLAVAGTEVAVVEHEHVQPGGGEHLGETVQVHLLDRGEAVRHDDGRSGAAGAAGRVEPAAQGDALCIELDVTPSHFLLLLPRWRLARAQVRSGLSATVIPAPQASCLTLEQSRQARWHGGACIRR